MKSVGRPAASSLGFTVKSTTVDAPMIKGQWCADDRDPVDESEHGGNQHRTEFSNNLAMFWSNFVISKAMILNELGSVGSVSTVAYGT